MRGILSQAMVMCAKVDGKIEILTPPTGAVPGDVVEFEGYARSLSALRLLRADPTQASLTPR